MKINNIKSKNKLIQLQILKSRIYKKKLVKKYTEKIEIDIYKLYFKKIAHIIYEYHVNGKKILFLNFPKTIEKNIKLILLKTKHLCISFKDLLKKTLNKQKFINKRNKLLLTNQNNFDLILLFNLELNIINKYLSVKIPTILITNSFNKIF